MANNDPKVIDDYIQALNPPDDALLHALKESDNQGLPQINVSPNEGRLLYILARMAGARKILELGILGGFSTINLARALPEGGKLISLEYLQKNADVARSNIDYAGLGDKVEIRVGAGLDLLPQLVEEGAGPFDLFFIDADKENYAAYGRWAARNVRAGGLLIGDNVFLFRELLDDTPRAAEMRRFHEEARAAFDTVAIPTPDGLLLGIKR